MYVWYISNVHIFNNILRKFSFIRQLVLFRNVIFRVGNENFFEAAGPIDLKLSPPF